MDNGERKDWGDELVPRNELEALDAELKRFLEREPLVDELLMRAEQRDFDSSAYDSVMLRQAAEAVRDFKPAASKASDAADGGAFDRLVHPTGRHPDGGCGCAGEPNDSPCEYHASPGDAADGGELGCQCTHEQGDSDCPIHVICCECGADISGQTVVRERARLEAEVRRLREELSTANAALEVSTDERIRLADEVRRLREAGKGLCANCGFSCSVVDETDELRDEVRRLREREAEFCSLALDKDAEVSRLRAEMKDVRAEMKDVREELSVTKAITVLCCNEKQPEITRLRGELKALRDEVERLREERDTFLSGHVASLKAKLASVEALPAQWREVVQQLRNGYAEEQAEGCGIRSCAIDLEHALRDPQPSAATPCEHAWIYYSRPPMRAVTGRQCTKCRLIEEPAKGEPYNGY